MAAIGRMGRITSLGYTLGTTFQLHREPAGLDERGIPQGKEISRTHATL
jgi:hypothetical protein